MKALTLWQPWASLVALGEKKIETRSWSTQHRGQLAIHAAARWTPELKKLAYHTEPFREVLARHHIIPTQRYGMTAEHIRLGVIVAICWLDDCVKITPEFAGRLSSQELAFGDYTLGRYAWILGNIEQLPEPELCPGHQGLWNWERIQIGRF